MAADGAPWPPSSATTVPACLQVLAAVVLALVFTGCLSPGQDSVHRELNADRAAHGLKQLPTHDALNAKAQAWAEYLARRGSLVHSTLSSGLPSCWRGVGENVGYGPSVPSIEDAYMDSTGHRHNILGTTWDWVGVGMAKSGNRVYTVQVFMDGC